MSAALRYRAAWVVTAAVGFWVLAIGLTVALAAGGVAIIAYAPDYVVAGLTAFVLAGAIAFGAMPAISFKAEQDAAPLEARDAPRLHALVADVATRVGERPPEALFLTHDANAFAGAIRLRRLARRQRSVGIGLPLLAVLTRDEASAVLAHEMGHHVAGDVRLGPWVHRTRRAIARTVDRLEGSSFWLHLPFVAYADFFLKTSVRISRAQELQADAVAARVAGPAAAASALRKTEILSAAWRAYFRGEVLPIVDKGRLPPLLAGFDLYWRAAQTPGTLAFEALSAQVAGSANAQPEDTHPPLHERVAALGDPAALSDPTGSALDLLDDVPAAEERVVRDLLRDPKMALAPVAWDAIVGEVWLPGWRAIVKPHASALAGLTAAALPASLERWQPLAEATRVGTAIFSPEAERRGLARLLGTWLAVRLADRGFPIEAPPGLAVIARAKDKVIEPYAVVAAMLEPAPEARGEWERTCEELGI